MTKYDLDFSDKKTTEASGTSENGKTRFIQIKTEKDIIILTFTREQWFFITEMFADELNDQEKDELISIIQ